MRPGHGQCREAPPRTPFFRWRDVPHALAIGVGLLTRIVCEARITRVAAAIAARGCRLWFLPTYSPDYSPIEAAFAKLKAAWRRAAARTVAALHDTICDSLLTITPTDARNFFRNCGYPIPPAMVQSV